MSSSGGTAARRIPRRSSELRGVLSRRGSRPGRRSSCVEIATDEQARRERFFGSPTIRIDGEDVVPPAEGDPVGLSCRVYRLRDGRPSPTPDPDGPREKPCGGGPMRLGDSAPRPDPARHRRTGPRPRRRRRHRCGVHLQPLPLRARLARPHRGRGARLRRPRRPGAGGQPQRRRALPGRLLRRDEGARGEATAAGRCPTSATRASRRRARSTPRRRRTSSSSTRRAGSATAARPTPTTAIRRRTPPGSAPPSTPCWRARARGGRRRSRWAAASSGSPESRPVAGAGRRARARRGHFLGHLRLPRRAEEPQPGSAHGARSSRKGRASC